MINQIKKRVVVLGAPGSGKQTFIDAFGKKGHQYGHISPGEIGRKEREKGSELGFRIEAYQQAGLLAPMSDIKELMCPWIEKYLEYSLMFLDGFPRNYDQIDLLFDLGKDYNFSSIEVIYVDTPPEICFDRLLSAKRGRSDDGDPGIAKARLEVFKKETLPVIDWFEHGDGSHRLHFNSINGSDMENHAPKFVDDFVDVWGLLL